MWRGTAPKKKAWAVPALRVLLSDQPEVGLVDQGRRLERLARLLLGQPLRGQLAQLVVDQGQELLGRVGVAPLDGREDAGHVVHRRRPPRAVPPNLWCYPGPVARVAAPPTRRGDDPELA